MMYHNNRSSIATTGRIRRTGTISEYSVAGSSSTMIDTSEGKIYKYVVQLAD
jgi:hypothetical protein